MYKLLQYNDFADYASAQMFEPQCEIFILTVDRLSSWLWIFIWRGA